MKYILTGLSLLCSQIALAASVDVMVSPSTIPYGSTSTVTYTITNNTGVAFTNTYLNLPINFTTVGLGKSFLTPYSLTNATTCAVNATKKGTFPNGASCNIVMKINPSNLGTLQFSKIVAISDQLGSATLPLTSSTTLKVTPSKIYYFGDSYVDIGCETTGGNVDYDKWPVYLNADLGLPVTQPDRLGGTDYACGGAETIHYQYASGVGIYIGLLDQMDKLTTNVKGKADPKALYIMLIGGNDLAHGSGTYEQRTAPPIANIKLAILQLQLLGAKNIIVINQMNQFAFVPTSTNSILWGALTRYFNNALLTMNNTLASPVSIYNLADAFAYMVLFPATYGYANVYDGCDSYPATCSQVNQDVGSVLPFLNAAPGNIPPQTPIAWFFANVHPTAAGYAFIEVELRNYIYPPTY